MKIKINIGKKQVFFLSILMILIFMGLVLADWDGATPYHEILYTDKIIGKSVSTIILDDDLSVTKKLTINDGIHINNGDLKIDGKIDISPDPEWSTTTKAEGDALRFRIIGSGKSEEIKCGNNKVMIGLEGKAVTENPEHVKFRVYCVSIEDILN